MKIDLEVEEINLVLEALSDLPFKKVFLLINKIREQGNSQLVETPADAPLEGEVFPPM
jgi:hypothetical protein